MRKSIKQTMTVLAGTIKRGKYTFVNKLELVSNELLASLKEDEKNCQGKVAAQTSKTLGTPSGTFELNNQPIKTITDKVSKGRMILQAIPIPVCL